MTRRHVIAVVAVVALVVAGGVGGFLSTRKHETPGLTTAEAFAAAWSSQHLDQAAYAGLAPADTAKDYQSATPGLSSMPVNVRIVKVAKQAGGRVATAHVTWTISDRPWEYDTTIPLVKERKQWLVKWSRSIIHPKLQGTDQLRLRRVQPARADILGGDGGAMVTTRPTVRVGVMPKNATDVDHLTSDLATLLQIDSAALAKQIRAARPDAFVEVVTLRRPDYEAVRGANLQALPGTVFEEGTLPLGPSRQFASAVLGRVGPVTAEIVEKSKGRYQSGDTGGLSGLELQYDERLAGVAGANVQFVSSRVAQPETLFTVESRAGQPVQITLTEPAQNAAEGAIAGQPKPAALVAMQISTGNILAVANGPEIGGFNRALAGQYPPGSSFKVVSTYALLQKGVTPDDDVPCPPTITVNGRVLKNAEDETFATAPFRKDFAFSCNTAFISLAPKLGNDTLNKTADAFGLGRKWATGTTTYSGSVPVTQTDLDRAVTTFGQGRTLVSPVAMANVAASVGRGSWIQPNFVVNPAQTALPSTPLDAPTIATLRSLMRDVVTSGTGTAANVPGEPVYGKTGTAEFGTKNPPEAHAWFVGYRGDVAFAAFVEGGEFGGKTAAPIAAKFLGSFTL